MERSFLCVSARALLLEEGAHRLQCVFGRSSEALRPSEREPRRASPSRSRSAVSPLRRASKYQARPDPAVEKVKVAQPVRSSRARTREDPGRGGTHHGSDDPETAVVRDLDRERDLVPRLLRRHGAEDEAMRQVDLAIGIVGRAAVGLSSMTTAVTADTACEVPPSFLATSITRMRAPTSAVVSLYGAAKRSSSRSPRRRCCTAARRSSW